MRAYFYPRDEDVDVAVSEIAGMLTGWGIGGSKADAIRFAIRYTAEAHGLIPASIGRVVEKASHAKRSEHVKKPDGEGSS